MRYVILCVCLSLLSLVPCAGAGLTVPGLDQVLEQAEDYGVSGDGELDSGLSNLFQDAWGQLGALLRASAATALKLLAVVVLCAVAESVCPAGERDGLQAVEVRPSAGWTCLPRPCCR